jgi:hypoxanthine phosphoribosyltransferase
MQTKNQTWEDIENQCLELFKSIKRSSFSFDVIVPIIRGGLVPGTILSHLFASRKVPIIPLQWQTRDGKQSKTALDSLLMQYSKILFVDDLIDSGKTIGGIANQIELFNSTIQGRSISFRFAVMLFNMDHSECLGSSITNKIFVATPYFSYPGNEIWWDFPWE